MSYEVSVGADRVPVKSWTIGVPFDEKARQQVEHLATLPFIHQHIAIMPDVHWGMGATIGSVIATKGAIIPAAVGVDIGCGMCAVQTTLTANDLPDSLANIRASIEEAVPVGQGQHLADVDVPEGHYDGLSKILAKHPDIAKLAKQHPATKAALQSGTLGGGNHFIEICLDESDQVWVMLHSGSRGIGNMIGRYFIGLAKEDMRVHHINLPDRDLAYLSEGTRHFDDYVEAVGWSQNYARVNREIMLDLVLDCLRCELPTGWAIRAAAVNCHHNYVEQEHHFGANVWITRKGAVRARSGDLGIIPGSMGERSFIVRGLGNAESFTSCSHGAGRAMSRGEAKRTITQDDHIAATAGVECRKDAGVIDESPSAYKDIDKVMAAQRDLVEVVHTLKQIVCVKG